MTPHRSVNQFGRPLRGLSWTQGELGSVTLFLVITMTATVALLTLVVDGGATQRARSESFGLASGAARAGAQQLDDDARTAGIVQLDPAAATQAAHDYLASHATTGDVTVEVDTVTVTAERAVNWTFWPGTAQVASTATVEAQQEPTP